MSQISLLKSFIRYQTTSSSSSSSSSCCLLCPLVSPQPSILHPTAHIPSSESSFDMLSWPHLYATSILIAATATAHPATPPQSPFRAGAIINQDVNDYGKPYSLLDPGEMSFHNLHISGSITNRVNLVFFGDGCEFMNLLPYLNQDASKLIPIFEDTEPGLPKFLDDARTLTKDITKPGASYGPVSKLLNIHAVFVASNEVCHVSGWGLGGVCLLSDEVDGGLVVRYRNAWNTQGVGSV